MIIYSGIFQSPAQATGFAHKFVKFGDTMRQSVRSLE
jgi:hypothetical protein